VSLEIAEIQVLFAVRIDEGIKLASIAIRGVGSSGDESVEDEPEELVGDLP
jgi:hypothetical protein